MSLKPIVITGGGSGIGLATAQTLLERPDIQIVLVGKNRARLDEAAQKLGGIGDRVSVLECDLADRADVARTITHLNSLHPHLYGLVNNAGIYPFGAASTTTLDQWDETFQVNLTAPFQLIQGLIPALSKHPAGGRIVNISSTAGILPNHFALAYTVSKAALIQLTKTLAKELGPKNITVNCVCPGIVRTPLHGAYHHSETATEEFYAKRGSTFPLGRVGEPEDVAHAVSFFLSEKSEWVTGDIFVIDGGRLLL